MVFNHFESTEEKSAATKTVIYHPTVTVVRDLYNTSFSGHLLDNCLANYAINKQIKTMKRQVADSELTLVKRRRVYNDIKKAKVNLSASKELGFNVEDFFNDRSLNIKLGRVEFEENCDQLFATFESIMVDFLFLIEKEKITRTEIIGGLVRIPKIQEILRDKFKLTLSTTINGDEGMSHGAAFISANSTAGVKIKKLYVNDGPNYKVDLNIDFPSGESESKSTEIFPFKSNYGSKKKISIKQLKSSSTVSLRANDSSNYTVSFNVSGIEKGLDKYAKKNITDWKVVFNFHLDNLGIPRLPLVELLLKEEFTENKNKTVTKTNATDGTNYTESITESIPKVNNITYRLNIDKLDESYKSLLDRKEFYSESKPLLIIFV